MGDVGNFIFGGSKQKSSSDSSSGSTQSSSNQSQNSSTQASVNTARSHQGSASGSNSYNQSYAPVSQAMDPALNYTTAGGNMLAAMLGIPGYTATHGPAGPALPAAYTPPAAPSIPVEPASSSTTDLSGLVDLLGQMAQSATSTSTPATPATPTPSSTTPVSTQPSTGGTYPLPPGQPSAGGAPAPSGSTAHQDLIAERTGIAGTHASYRAAGGPVAAGQPYVVGENQAEVFVPHTNGTILPSVPNGMMPTAQGTPGAQVGLGGRLQNPMMNTMFNHFGGGLQNPGGMGPRGPKQKNHGGLGQTPFPVDPIHHPPVPPVVQQGGGAGVGAGAPAGGPSPQQSALDTFFNSTGGQFLMNQGQNAINSNGSASGFLQSGATGKALEKYGQGVASQYMNDYINHVLDFSKLGLGAATAMSGAGNVSGNSSVSSGGSSSSGVSVGHSQGTSTGSSTGSSSSTGTSTGTGSQKNGLLPDLAKFGSPGAGAGAGG